MTSNSLAVQRRGGSSVVERRRVVVAKAATKTAYICVDCGYIYDGSTAFEKLPNSYKCPVCSAPKRRFKPYAGRPGGNDAKAMKARMAELKGGGATKQQSGGGDTNGALAIVAGGAILLAALYFGLNGVYN